MKSVISDVFGCLAGDNSLSAIHHAWLIPRNKKGAKCSYALGASSVYAMPPMQHPMRVAPQDLAALCARLV
jgi:hypothetical protein